MKYTGKMFEYLFFKNNSATDCGINMQESKAILNSKLVKT